MIRVNEAYASTDCHDSSALISRWIEEGGCIGYIIMIQSKMYDNTSLTFAIFGDRCMI